MTGYRSAWIYIGVVLFFAWTAPFASAQDKPAEGGMMGMGMGMGMMGNPLPAGSGTTNPSWVPVPGQPRCVGLAGDPWLSCDNGGVYKRAEDPKVSSFSDVMNRISRFSGRTVEKITKSETDVGNASCQIVTTEETLNCGGYSYQQDHTAITDATIKPAELPADGTSRQKTDPPTTDAALH